MVYYIYAGTNGSCEDLYKNQSGDLSTYATQSATKTEQKTYEDVELVSANDGTGRYESMTYKDEKGKSITVKMTQQTVQDEDGYNAAMETYTAQKAIYDKTIAEIDQKTKNRPRKNPGSVECQNYLPAFLAAFALAFSS